MSSFKLFSVVLFHPFWLVYVSRRRPDELPLEFHWMREAWALPVIDLVICTCVVTFGLASLPLLWGDQRSHIVLVPFALSLAAYGVLGFFIYAYSLLWAFTSSLVVHPDAD